jgi:hypothetical protein
MLWYKLLHHLELTDAPQNSAVFSFTAVYLEVGVRTIFLQVYCRPVWFHEKLMFHRSILESGGINQIIYKWLLESNVHVFRPGGLDRSDYMIR